MHIYTSVFDTFPVSRDVYAQARYQAWIRSGCLHPWIPRSHLNVVAAAKVLVVH